MPYGALPPKGALHQNGDRADKTCVLEALNWLSTEDLTYATMQHAIDIYLTEAKKHGWVLVGKDQLK